MKTLSAIAVPVLVFGFLYVMVVAPHRAAADQAQRRLEEARAEVESRRMAVSAIRAVGSSATQVAFDASFAQIAQFVRSMSSQGRAPDVQSVEATTSSTPGLMRVDIRIGSPASTTGAAPVSSTAPDVDPQPRTGGDSPARESAGRNAVISRPPSDPKVTGVLFSGGRKVALVDGLVVGPGDRIDAGVVESIDEDGIVLRGADGTSRRIAIQR